MGPCLKLGLCPASDMSVPLLCGVSLTVLTKAEKIVCLPRGFLRTYEEYGFMVGLPYPTFHRIDLHVLPQFFPPPQGLIVIYHISDNNAAFSTDSVKLFIA